MPACSTARSVRHASEPFGRQMPIGDFGGSFMRTKKSDSRSMAS